MEEQIDVNLVESNVLNAIENESENDFDLCNDTGCLNIAIIGKTGSGKSSFLNALRGLRENDPNAAKAAATIKGNLFEANNSKFKYKKKVDNMDVVINFFDTVGFMDNNNTDIEYFLNEIKIIFNIIEFDAIIFVTNDKLSNQELKIAQTNEKKSVMLFFVYNKTDNLYRNHLQPAQKLNDEVPFVDQVREHRKFLEDKLEDTRKDACKLLHDHKVFSSIMLDIEKFSSINLKNDEYKNKLIEESLYFVRSSPIKYFEDEIFSRDGKRLKKELENLIRSKFNNMNINLLDKFSKRTIYLKKKSIKKNISLFKGKELKLSIAVMTSIVPFLDILGTRMMKNSFKPEFFEKFGLKEVKEKIEKNPSLVTNDDQKIEKILKIFEKIDKDEVIKNLDEILDTSNIKDISSLRERIKNLINNILPAIGITAASLTDDFISKIGGLAIAISKTTLIVISLMSIPISITIFLFLLKKGVERVLSRFEEYALLIWEVLHN